MFKEAGRGGKGRGGLLGVEMGREEGQREGFEGGGKGRRGKGGVKRVGAKGDGWGGGIGVLTLHLKQVNLPNAFGDLSK